MDLYQLLKQDHLKAKRLLERINQTSNGGSKSRQRLFAELKQELELHTEVEETHFYPALKRHDETKDLVEEALADHEEVQKLLEELDQVDQEDESWADQFAELQESVEHHIEQEETELFRLAQEVLETSKADEIAKAIEKRKAAAKAR